MKSEYRVEVHPQYKYKRIQPTPTDEEIEQYYRDEFYSSEYKNFNDSELEVQLADRSFFESNWQEIMDNLERLVDGDVAGRSILDIGCGWGLALKYYAGLGLDVYGLDPSPEAIEYAAKNGVTVRQSGIKNLETFDGMTFDFLTLMNVLEHIAAPEEYLRQISDKVMDDSSILVIDVPNEFNALQICGQKVNELDEWWVAAPQHLNYFDLESLNCVLEAAGLELLHAQSSFPLEIFLAMGDNYVGDHTIGHDCHKKRVQFETNMRVHGFGAKLRELYTSLAEIGLGRQVTVYAKRRS